jgi:hypothetical protein
MVQSVGVRPCLNLTTLLLVEKDSGSSWGGRGGMGGSSHLAPLLKKLRRIKTQIQILHQENYFFSPLERGMRPIRQGLPVPDWRAFVGNKLRF